ncbi:retrovirus-related Pol polyprotein from transposon 17.6 [Trichonephila clavipes]|nr:retrovirus-related Pol polyprotein from transposon 17.6 [Trichonephila clavipes]
MKPSKNSKEVSKFLGTAGWYQKFLPKYADICEPLYRLKKKGAKFNWSTEAQDSFDKIKRALTEAPVLQLPNFTEQFNLFTNACGIGIGALLNQNHRPIAFASRTLNKAKRNYTVTETECLAVIWALNKFKTYFGSLPVKVITDHAALTKLMNGKNLSSRMIRWALKLSEFSIEWEHRPGVQNVVVVVLSGNPVGNLDGSQISCAALRILALNSREQLIREQREDPELGHIYRYLKNPDDGSVNVTAEGEFNGKSESQFSPDYSLFCSRKSQNWDRFLHEFAFALRTSVNETTNKTPAELFLGRKIITPFRKLINVTEGAEYVGRNIEKLFDEARQNMRKQHKNWEKYYNRKRREVNIKVNDLVLIQTHFISAAGRRVVGKFMPKFEGPYRVLEVRNNNLIIWNKDKRVTVHIDQVRVYRPTRLVRTVMLRHYMKDRGRVIGQVDRNQDNSKDLGKPRVPLIQEIPGRTSHLQKGAGPKGQYYKARETRTTKNGTNRAAESRPVRSKQANAVRPCPYYLRSRVRQPECFPEERRNIVIESIPQNNIRRRSLSMEALGGDPVDRSE